MLTRSNIRFPTEEMFMEKSIHTSSLTRDEDGRIAQQIIILVVHISDRYNKKLWFGLQSIKQGIIKSLLLNTNAFVL